MSEVKHPKPGDFLKDNDPRMGNRVLEITADAGDYVLASDAMGKTFRILKRRIHMDGKARRGGFDLIHAIKA